MEPEGEIRGGASGCGQWVHGGLIASEASFLVCSMARIIYISGRTSCRKCSKINVSIYVYLNIRSMRYSAMQI